MTETLTRGAVGGPEPRHRERSVLLLVAAGLLVVVTVGAVLIFGVQRPPTLATMADVPDPAPPAAVAWTHQVADRACLRVAWPDGRVTEPWCGTGGGEVLGWTETGEVRIHTYDVGERVHEVDPVTGAVSRVTSGSIKWPEHRGVVWTEYRDGELVVRLDDGDVELWRVAAPEGYRIHSSEVSADGSWVAMVDSAERLLVVPADGSLAPRVWAAGVSAWQPPSWEGTDLAE